MLQMQTPALTRAAPGPSMVVARKAIVARAGRVHGPAYRPRPAEPRTGVREDPSPAARSAILGTAALVAPFLLVRPRWR
jgi:hypothetical protein